MDNEPLPAGRLQALRERLAAQNLAGWLVPRADAFLGEYVPPGDERLAWLTGFTGSAGLAVVLADRAALFADGRYLLQAARQVATPPFEIRHLIEEPPPGWIAAAAPGARIGYDPWLHTEPAIARFAAAGLEMVPTEPSPLDAAWTDRPAPPRLPARAHPLAFAGIPAERKRAEAAATLREAGEDAALLADPHSLAWLLNIRGGDLAHTPLALGFTLLRADATVQVFRDPETFDTALRAELGDAITLHPPQALPEAMRALAGQRVRVDADATPAWFARALREAGAAVLAGEDPCRLPRACKNAVEQAGARAAHRRDGVALARFLAWFAAEAPKGGLTESSAAAQLLGFRRPGEHFCGESFPAISGAGENGAIVHYRVTPETDRRIAAEECYLIDSGGQYLDGTTDVTRTLWTGPGAAPEALRERYTRVLQGHVALATLRFPAGVAGPHLDAIARRALWEAGLDYDHGTGHGVGSYLSVHEGPAGISRAARLVPLRPGMILSNEPGFYEPGAYGIRIENLLLVREAALPAAQKPFLEFETLTLAPYARALILPALLTAAERGWVDAYHARVAATLAPLVGPAVAAWLAEACAPL